MSLIKQLALAATLSAATTFAANAAFAQSTSGALVVVPATGEVVRANDLAIATFGVEEQDKDKAAAASRVNRKMAEGNLARVRKKLAGE